MKLDRDIILNGLLFAVAWLMAHSGLPSHPVIVLTILCAADLFFGVGRTIRCKESFTSRRFASGVLSKLGLILIPVLIGLALGAAGLADAHFIALFAVSALMVSELYSIISNVYAIKYGVKLPEWDVLSLIMRKIRETAEKLLGLR